MPKTINIKNNEHFETSQFAEGVHDSEVIA